MSDAGPVVRSLADGPVVAAAGLGKRYPNGTDALRGVDLGVERGELVGLLGPSGSGKTTLLRLVYGALRPTSGSLTVLGEDVAALRGARLRALRRRVAAIAQQHGLVARSSVLHNVLLGRLGSAPLWRLLWSSLAAGAEERAAAHRLLVALGLGGALYQRVDALSGGQQQRVAVARALLQGGDLLVADEPVASVDHDTAEVILGVLRRLVDEKGQTVLVSLHQRPLALAFCTRLVGLARGVVVYDGPPSEAAWRHVAEPGGTAAEPEREAGRPAGVAALAG